MTNLTKDQKIAITIKIMNDYDISSNFELDLDCSPTFASVGNSISLIEMYDSDCVTVLTYMNDNGNEIDEFNIPYSELSNELIDEIYNNFVSFQQRQIN